MLFMVSSSRFQKQLIIIFIYLIIFSLIGFLIYRFWFQQKPSCYDGIKNQREEAVDCGGPCISCEIKTLKNVEIIWNRVFLVKPLDFAQGKGIYDFAAQIKNPNSNYGVEEILYEFNLYDESGNLVLSKKGTTFLLPNEVKYIIEPAIELQENVFKINLVLNEPQWIKLSDQGESDLKGQIFIKNKQYQSLNGGDEGFYNVSGEVKNDSSFDFDRVLVNVALFNKENQPVAVNKTEIRTLIAGESRYFAVTWFSPIEDEIVSAETVIETNAFLNENFMKRYGSPEKFKELR